MYINLIFFARTDRKGGVVKAIKYMSIFGFFEVGEVRRLWRCVCVEAVWECRVRKRV